MSLIDDISKIEGTLRSAMLDLAALKLRVPIEMVHPPQPAPPIPSPPQPLITRRSAGVDKLRIQVLRAKQPNRVWRLTHLWTTYNGSWELSGQSIYCIPEWARNEFMRFFPLAGGDHHIYALTLDAMGRPLSNVQMKFWHNSGSVEKNTNGIGVAEQDIFGSFNPDDLAQSGGWSVSPGGLGGDVVGGMGLPMNHHVSLFGVWKWVV